MFVASPSRVCLSCGPPREPKVRALGGPYVTTPFRETHMWADAPSETLGRHRGGQKGPSGAHCLVSNPREVADLEIGPPQARRQTSRPEISLREATATSRAPELYGTRRMPPEALNRPFCVDWGGRSRVKSKFQDRPPGAATASEHKKRHGALRGRSSLFSALRHAGHLGHRVHSQVGIPGIAAEMGPPAFPPTEVGAPPSAPI